MSIARTLRNHNLAQQIARPFKTLDAVNAALVGDKILHPTRGWRKLTSRRIIISDLTLQMQHGRRGLDTQVLKDVIQGRVHL